MLKLLEAFEFESAPDLDTRLIRELSSGEYIKNKQNIIF
ncbi:MAG: ATP-binding protein [Desulfobacterales bacterium]|nr:ATP-binding protein [Desulfobacterales bacterium]